MCGLSGGSSGKAPTLPERQAAKAPDNGNVNARDDGEKRRRQLLQAMATGRAFNTTSPNTTKTVLGGA